MLRQRVAAQGAEREEAVTAAKAVQGALEGASSAEPGACLANSQHKHEPASDAREQ